MATVAGMFVVPEARGAGLGRALMVELLDRARQLPELTQVQLSVVVTPKPAARQLYHSLGFVPFGLERQALRLGDEWLDVEHLALFL